LGQGKFKHLGVPKAAFWHPASQQPSLPTALQPLFVNPSPKLLPLVFNLELVDAAQEGCRPFGGSVFLGQPILCSIRASYSSSFPILGRRWRHSAPREKLQAAVTPGW